MRHAVVEDDAQHLVGGAAGVVQVEQLVAGAAGAGDGGHRRCGREAEVGDHGEVYEVYLEVPKGGRRVARLNGGFVNRSRCCPCARVNHALRALALPAPSGGFFLSQLGGSWR